MPSSLPKEETLTKVMRDFGIGMYDSLLNDGESGEPVYDYEAASLPSPVDNYCKDEVLSSYASTTLPGDVDRPPHGRNQNDKIIDKVLPTFSQTELPNDKDNPIARSDYYDNMSMGSKSKVSMDDIWPDEDSGAYAHTELPKDTKNESNFDNRTKGIGNSWSGYIVEDLSGPSGFPSTDFSENADYLEDDDNSGRFLASGNEKMKKTSTNFSLVSDLADGVLKKFGKKDLTRRHVMAYLQEINQSQFLASDVVRCLSLCHGIDLNDNLNQFPISKKASNTPTLSSVVENLIDMTVICRDDPSISRELRLAYHSISNAIGLLSRAGRG